MSETQRNELAEPSGSGGFDFEAFKTKEIESMELGDVHQVFGLNEMLKEAKRRRDIKAKARKEKEAQSKNEARLVSLADHFPNERNNHD
tara:strand:+ start:1512 stop:1778 length:267 start_codon:yes stop_codon:yes gene_type:complete